jgi:thiamine biosynthesis lipoprotein
MSFFTENSDISKLNSMAGICSVKISPETFEVIDKAAMFSDISNGAFDITAAPVIKCWGIMSPHQQVPSESEILELVKLVDYRCVKTNKNKLEAGLEKKGQMADLGGIAKGYAADRIIEIYRKNNISSAFVNLGGNVMVLGTKQDGSFWRVGIQDPRGELNEIIGFIELKDKTVVTSGDYQRFFIADGVRYHHIIDPQTGYPARSGLISATVVTDRSINADALSTAVFILGADKGIKMLNGIKNTDAVLISEDGIVFVTAGLRDSFFLTDTDLKLEYI